MSSFDPKNIYLDYNEGLNGAGNWEATYTFLVTGAFDATDFILPTYHVNLGVVSQSVNGTVYAPGTTVPVTPLVSTNTYTVEIKPALRDLGINPNLGFDVIDSTGATRSYSMYFEGNNRVPEDLSNQGPPTTFNAITNAPYAPSTIGPLGSSVVWGSWNWQIVGGPVLFTVSDNFEILGLDQGAGMVAPFPTTEIPGTFGTTALFINSVASATNVSANDHFLNIQTRGIGEFGGRDLIRNYRINFDITLSSEGSIIVPDLALSSTVFVPVSVPDLELSAFVVDPVLVDDLALVSTVEDVVSASLNIVSRVAIPQPIDHVSVQNLRLISSIKIPEPVTVPELKLTALVADGVFSFNPVTSFCGELS